MSLRLIIAEDHAIIRDCVRAMLESSGRHQVVGEASTGKKAIELSKKLNPDLVLMDIELPDMSGIEATRKITEGSSNTKVLALTMHSTREYSVAMFQAGANGYILKDCDSHELFRAISYAMNDRTYIDPRMTSKLINDYISSSRFNPVYDIPELTRREQQVVQLLADGLKTHEIASILNISKKTVETHRRQIMEKLNIRGVVGLTKYALREGLTNLTSGLNHVIAAAN